MPAAGRAGRGREGLHGRCRAGWACAQSLAQLATLQAGCAATALCHPSSSSFLLGPQRKKVSQRLLTGLEALAVLFEAPALFAVAALVVPRAARVPAVRLRPRRSRAARQSELSGLVLHSCSTGTAASAAGIGTPEGGRDRQGASLIAHQPSWTGHRCASAQRSPRPQSLAGRRWGCAPRSPPPPPAQQQQQQKQ